MLVFGSWLYPPTAKQCTAIFSQRHLSFGSTSGRHSHTRTPLRNTPISTGHTLLKDHRPYYIGIELIFTGLMNKAGGISFLAAAGWGIFFIQSLNKGNDFSAFTLKNLTRKSKMKVVHQNKSAPTTYRNYRHVSDLPNQEEVDEILDKISVGGYESLTSREKEVLFKASKDDK